MYEVCYNKQKGDSMTIKIENCIIKVPYQSKIEIKCIDSYFVIIINGKAIAKTNSNKICIKPIK